MGPPMGGDPTLIPPKKEIKTSHLTLEVAGPVVYFNVNMVLTPAEFKRLGEVAAHLVLSLSHEVKMAADHGGKHALALGLKKMTEAKIPVWQEGTVGMVKKDGIGLPTGAFPRDKTANRAGMLPGERVSWMTALLPHLGHDILHRQVKPHQSWRDPANWMPGATLIPEFQDPSFPDSSRFVGVAGLPFEYGTTHFVGIAGVGADAASYPPGDPLFVDKRGAFGYDRWTPLKEIQEGRGLSNVAVMIQVPHDGPGGVGPWIAGGGATIRGVPETGSIAPFVLGKNREGAPATHMGKRGTFVIMADGSVRFVDQNVSDDVFKAMVTIKGAAPKGFDLEANPHTPLLPNPKAAKVDKEPAPEEGEKDPPKEPEEKKGDAAKPPEKKAEDPPALPAPMSWHTLPVLQPLVMASRPERAPPV